MRARRTILEVVVWLVVAPLVGFAAIRVLGLERGYPLAALLAFTPLVVPVAVVVALAALALRVRAAAAVALLVAIVLGGLVAPRALGGDTALRGPSLRVMTTNVFVARGDPATVVRLARRERVDVLAVQELDRPYARRLDREGLRELMPYRVRRFGPSTHSTALYSRRPIRPLPVPAGTDNPIARGTVAVGAATVELAAVHPPPPIARHVGDRDRELRAMLPAHPGGRLRVLAGDFNATLDHEPFRALLATGYRDAAERTGAGLRATWPNGRRLPPVTIDHIVADERIGFGAVDVLDLPGSDHRPVVATLTPPVRR